MVGPDARDLVDRVHAVRHLSESGVLSVEMGRIFVHDEKLGTRTVGHHASRHGNDAARVLEIVRGKAVHAEFACNGISGSAHARCV